MSMAFKSSAFGVWPRPKVGDCAKATADAAGWAASRSPACIPGKARDERLALQRPTAIAGRSPDRLALQRPAAIAGRSPDRLALQRPAAIAGRSPDRLALQRPAAVAGRSPD